jgi:hypothetical protein
VPSRSGIAFAHNSAKGVGAQSMCSTFGLLEDIIGEQSAAKTIGKPVIRSYPISPTRSLHSRPLIHAVLHPTHPFLYLRKELKAPQPGFGQGQGFLHCTHQAGFARFRTEISRTTLLTFPPPAAA